LTRPVAIIPLGDQAVFVEYAQTLDLYVNAAAQRLAARIRARTVIWLSDIVPTLGGVALYPDFGHAQLPAKPFEAIQALVEECLDDAGAVPQSPVRLIEVPVCYEPEFALDLAQLASQLNMTVDAVIRLHTAPEYRVLMMGFVPGHAYLGGLDERLSVPRRDSPRAQVPAGSIAIANGQAVIYPFQTPGGWSIIGRTPMRLFDAYRDPPCVFAPEDGVRFVAISAAQFRAFKDDESSFTRAAAQR
jgi:KipI family sensor histidine kinase inhibitor